MTKNRVLTVLGDSWGTPDSNEDNVTIVHAQSIPQEQQATMRRA